MHKIILTLVILAIGTGSMKAQESNNSYFRTIPDHADKYTAGTVAARMIDGLGFRFYWATDSLREEDLNFRPGQEQRSIAETIDHIYEMSFIILNTVIKEPLMPNEHLTYQQKRETTLNNLQRISQLLVKSTDEDFATYNITFGNGKEYPFWNMINGPIADSLWHCGQIVSFRRSSGNPFNSNVSVFNGRLRN